MKLSINTFLLVLLLSRLAFASSNAPAIPVIEAGHEAEIEGLFSEIGKGATSGWSVPDISIPRDRIQAHFLGPQGQKFILELRYPSNNTKAIAKSPSFEFFVMENQNISIESAIAIAQESAKEISIKDDGSFWISRSEGVSPVIKSTLGRWFSTPGGLATIAWMTALWFLAVFLSIIVIRNKPWQDKTSRRVLIEIIILTTLALVVRQWLMTPGAGQNVARIPIPSLPPYSYPQFGCGYGGWVLSWYMILGVDDSVAFFAGGIAGALTVIPVYLLAWKGFKERWAGFVAATAIALWSVHARLSATNDEGSLIALLLVSALALIVVADSKKSSSLLICGWLAGCLGATVRPEASLALLPLGLIVLGMPAVRRLQFRIPTLLVTTALGVVTCLAVYTAGTEAMSGGFSPLYCATNLEALGLFDLTERSLLGPPLTPWILTVLLLVGLLLAFYKTRLRVLLWCCVTLLPSLPLACFSKPNIITARYHLHSVPIAAVMVGLGASWLAITLIRILPRAGKWLVTFVALASLIPVLTPILNPPDEPTFKLEYDFFRKNITKIPAGCKVLLNHWDGDIGLRTQAYLTNLLELDHIWIESTNDLDASKECLVYWQAASCRAAPQIIQHGDIDILPSCKSIESVYRLKPIATDNLPARPEFTDYYFIDPVPVGFYRLQPLTPSYSESDCQGWTCWWSTTTRLFMQMSSACSLSGKSNISKSESGAASPNR
jgi:dolichyl-phosphate-mannose-protein mannosyltransferase